MADNMLRDRPASPRSFVFLAAWHVLAVLLVLLLPASLKFREPLWAIPAEHVPSLLAMAVAYLAGAWAVEAGLRSVATPSLARLAGLSLVAASCYPLALLVMLLRPDLPYSRAALVLAAALGMGLLLASLLSPRVRIYALVLLLAAVAVTAGEGVYRAGVPRASPFGFTAGAERPFIMSNQQFLSLKYQKGAVGHQTVRGGALAPFEDGFLLVTGAGDFFRLGWKEGSDELDVTRLPITAPGNRTEFIADIGSEAPARYFRVAGLEIDRQAQPPELYVSHHHWNRDERCFTLRVSVAPLPPAAASGGPTPWRTLFESRPCLRVVRDFENSMQAGGRMAWLGDGRLLLTVGDHGFDGLDGENLPQDADADYGKNLAISADGGHTVYSMGHRNAQGLAIDGQGQVWIAEHGPQGGDELNRIIEGRNYGWPLVTYGTQYQMTYWPLSEGQRDHGEFEEPAYVWVPSPALSGLIALESDRFPAWRGDLLASSLRAESLYRIRLRGATVVYAEPIRVGRRIRDLAEARDGRIVLLSETGDLVTIAPGDVADSAQALYSQCAACHEASGGQAAAAPSLKGIVGRRVASVAGYQYSEALQQLGGNWDVPRLAEYVRNPAAVAPGTTMSFHWRHSEAQLRSLIEYLRHHR